MPENIFKNKFDNITNEDVAAKVGTSADDPQLHIKMFNKIEQENIEFYLAEGKSPAEAKKMAAERKHYAMVNAGFIDE